MPKTVRFDLTAAPAAPAKTQGNRRMPTTPEKHSRVLQSQKLTFVQQQHPKRTSKDIEKTRKHQTAGQQENQHRKAVIRRDKSNVQPRDTKGRFTKSTRKPTKTEVLLEKLRVKNEETKRQIKELEVALEIENKNRNAQENKRQVKATKKLAKDYKWICLRVLDLQKKLEFGTKSQQNYAKSQLPKYTRRRQEAQAAKITLEENNNSSQKAFEAHKQTCTQKDARNPLQNAQGEEKVPPEPGDETAARHASTADTETEDKSRLKGTTHSPCPIFVEEKETQESPQRRQPTQRGRSKMNDRMLPNKKGEPSSA